MPAWGGERQDLHTVLACAADTSTGMTLGHVGHHAWHAEWQPAVLGWLFTPAAGGHLGCTIMKPAMQNAILVTIAGRQDVFAQRGVGLPVIGVSCCRVCKVA